MKADLIVLGVGIILCSVPAQCDIILYSIDTRKIGLEVKDQPALFGPPLPIDGLRVCFGYKFYLDFKVFLGIVGLLAACERVCACTAPADAVSQFLREMDFAY